MAVYEVLADVTYGFACTKVLILLIVLIVLVTVRPLKLRLVNKRCQALVFFRLCDVGDTSGWVGQKKSSVRNCQRFRVHVHRARDSTEPYPGRCHTEIYRGTIYGHEQGSWFLWFLWQCPEKRRLETITRRCIRRRTNAVPALGIVPTIRTHRRDTSDPHY